MDDRNDQDRMADELTGLPRSREPGRLLEERTVSALRSRGLLRPSPRKIWWPAAAAAAVAFFATGYALGQRSASIALIETAFESQQQAAMQAAMQVQRTGSAWIAALNALARLPEDADSEAVRQGREAARAALTAAAAEFAGIAPTDPVSAQLLWVLSGPADADEPAGQSRAVVWF